MMERLWGHNFSDPATHKWKTETTGRLATCNRGFLQSRCQPINQIAAICVGRKQESVEDVPCGNTVALDQFITKNATLTGEKETDACPIRAIEFSVSPVARVAVPCKVASDPRKLAEGFKRLAKSDPMALCSLEVSDEHIPTARRVTFASQLTANPRLLEPVYLVEIQTPENALGGIHGVLNEKRGHAFEEFCVGKKQEPVKDVPCGNSVALVGLDQFITKKAALTCEKETDACLIRAMEFSAPPVARVAVRCKVASDQPKLTEGFKRLAKSDPMVLCSIEESDEHTIAAARGFLLDVCGICFQVCDAVLHTDAIHGGSGQVFPTARRVTFASQLTAKPRLLEHVYLVEIQAPENALGGIHGVLNQKRGHMLQEMQRPGTPMYNIKAYLHVIWILGYP